MENRWSYRTPLQLGVLIHYGPLGLIRGVSENVSAEGMFVNTGRIALSDDELVEVTFSYPNSTEGRTFSISANIVHTSEEGTGLQFINFNFDALSRYYTRIANIA